MPVIAMTREMGSLGMEVAKGVVKELGLKLVCHEIVDSLARKMHLSESAVLRFVQGRAGLRERWRADMDGLSLYAAEEVFDLATAGNVVICGWGATHLLRPVRHVLRVRVCAPFKLRVRRIMYRLGLQDLELAADEVRRSDAAHAAATRRRFDIDWRNPARYDLVLNTERNTVEHCIAQIKCMLEFPEFRPTPDSRARLEGLALSARIRAALRRDPVTTGFPIGVDSDPCGHPGRVILRGIVLDEDQRRAAEKLAWRIRGVRAVGNGVRPLWRGFGTKHRDALAPARHAHAAQLPRGTS